MTLKFNMHYHSQFYSTLHTDINECTETNHSCPLVNGNCTNTIGSFYCVCDQGYEFNADESKCIGKMWGPAVFEKWLWNRCEILKYGEFAQADRFKRRICLNWPEIGLKAVKFCQILRISGDIWCFSVLVLDWIWLTILDPQW